MNYKEIILKQTIRTINKKGSSFKPQTIAANYLGDVDPYDNSDYEGMNLTLIDLENKGLVKVERKKYKSFYKIEKENMEVKKIVVIPEKFLEVTKEWLVEKNRKETGYYDDSINDK